MGKQIEMFMRERDYTTARRIQDQILQILAVYNLPARATTDLVRLAKFSRDHAENLFLVREEMKAVFWPTPQKETDDVESDVS